MVHILGGFVKLKEFQKAEKNSEVGGRVMPQLEFFFGNNVFLRLPPTRGRLLVFVRSRPPARAGGGRNRTKTSTYGGAAHGHRLSSMSP